MVFEHFNENFYKDMRPILYVITFFLCLATIAQAQRRPEPCATMEMDSLLRLRNPQEGSLDDFERGIKAAENAADVQAVKEGMVLIFQKFKNI